MRAFGESQWLFPGGHDQGKHHHLLMFSKLDGFQKLEALAQFLSSCLMKKRMKLESVEHKEMAPRDQMAPLCLSFRKSFACIFFKEFGAKHF